MKKLILLAISQLLFCSMLFAQTDDPGCNLYVTQVDVGCTTGQTSCPGSIGCTSSSNFRVVCSGNFSIKAWTTCGTGSCSNCASCVSIYTAGQGDLVATCTNLSTCGVTCCSVCSGVYLLSGDYVMRVCLVPCPSGNEEDCCDGACKAYGAISSNALSCP